MDVLVPQSGDVRAVSSAVRAGAPPVAPAGIVSQVGTPTPPLPRAKSQPAPPTRASPVSPASLRGIAGVEPPILLPAPIPQQPTSSNGDYRTHHFAEAMRDGPIPRP